MKHTYHKYYRILNPGFLMARRLKNRYAILLNDGTEYHIKAETFEQLFEVGDDEQDNDNETAT